MCSACVALIESADCVDFVLQSRPNDPSAYMTATGPPPDATRIVKLAEAVTIEELTNDEEYNDIMDDMREECGKVGAPCEGLRLLINLFMFAARL